MLKLKYKKRISKFYSYIRFRDFTLQKKILTTYIIMLIIPLVAFSCYFLTNYITRREEEALNLIKKVNEQSMWTIEAYVNQLKNITILPLYDSDALGVLRDKLSGADTEKQYKKLFTGDTIQYSAPNSRGFYSNDQKVIDALITKIMAMNKNIYSVFIASPNGDYVYRLINNSLINNENYKYSPVTEEWYTLGLINQGMAAVGRTKRFDQYVEDRGTPIYTFFVSRAVNDIFGGKNIGAICIGTDIRYIRNMLTGAEMVQGERVLIVDDSGWVIYDNNENNIASNINDKSFDLSGINNLNFENSINQLKVDKKNYTVISVKSGNTGWNLLRVIPRDIVFNASATLRRQFLLMIGGIAIITLVITAFVSKSITNPLKKLVNTMNTVGQGDLSVRFQVRNSDEVGILGESFNSMINKIDILVNTVHATQLRKRETELSALQAQINPHFIYNTLESIRRMAELNDDNDTAEMTFLLGKMLRYSINIKNRIVTVQNEIDHVNHYFGLQNFRFGNRFKLVWDIPEELYSISIIKLIFQPVVENAIYHGLQPLKGEGTIYLKGFRENEFICFAISDDGVGMTEHQLEALNKKITDFTSEDDSKSIGLRNINERIKLYYGSGYGLDISSQPAKGTTVLFKLPGVKIQ